MPDIEQLLQQIRDQGERITLQRRLVLDALTGVHDHLTIGEIQALIEQKDGGQSIPETTIYRILQWLKDIGIAAQTDMGQAGLVYALVGDPVHHHLICLTCGAVITIDDSYFEPLRQRLMQEHGFDARIDHMAIYGQCRRCAGK